MNLRQRLGAILATVSLAAVSACSSPEQAPDTAGEGASASAGASAQATRIVAITACPTGIAHTYMAADALTQTAGERDDVP